MNNLRITPASLQALADDNRENFVAASTPGGIEAQEARGQQTFIELDILPREKLDNLTREQMETLGFVFGKDRVDDLFVNAKLPEGWKKVPTEHSMWSELHDTKDSVRFLVFYKAAFYDRKAHIQIIKRFSCDDSPEDQYKTKQTLEARDKGFWFGVVKDCKGGKDIIIYRTPPKKAPNQTDTKVLVGLARMWLEKNYPKYKDPLAYWD